MNITRKRFRELIAGASSPEEVLVWFGALLSKECGARVEIVGGSAIEIYLSSAEYISQDVDLVGPKDAIAGVLRRWGFHEVVGRSQRTYWHDPRVGLVDLIGKKDKSGLPPRRIETVHGAVWISAVEPLIAHRLVRALREPRSPFLRQATALARGRVLDWEYLAIISRFEGSETQFRKLQSAVRTRHRRST